VIGYAFLSVGCLGTVLVVAAVRYGYSPAEAARKAVEGSGVRRITARQLRHNLRLAEHELAGAGEYISRLERDRRELSALLEQRSAELDSAKEQLAKATRQIHERDQQLDAFDATCAENTSLRAELDNARAMRQQLPGPSPADDASALPDDVQEFVDATAGAWRAGA
jgi:predicted RNase H-like nuclease (RuvC/YqgF family)